MNLFDELNGIEEEGTELNGFFKKLKKKVKSAVKSVRNVTSKVGRKVLPSAVRKVGRQLDKAGITKIAAGAALMFVGGPAIAAGLKGTKLASLGAKGLSLAKSAASAVKLKSVAGGVKTAAGLIGSANAYKSKQQQAAQAQQAEQVAQQKVNYAGQLAVAAGESPEFAQAVAQFRAQGYSDEQILQHWIESKSYYLAAVPEVAQTVYPQVKQTVLQNGFTGDTANELALQESYRIADEEVKKVQSNATNLTPLLIGGALLLLTKGL